jgi:hypothetical protein
MCATDSSRLQAAQLVERSESEADPETDPETETEAETETETEAETDAETETEAETEAETESDCDPRDTCQDRCSLASPATTKAAAASTTTANSVRASRSPACTPARRGRARTREGVSWAGGSAAGRILASLSNHR